VVQLKKEIIHSFIYLFQTTEVGSLNWR